MAGLSDAAQGVVATARQAVAALAPGEGARVCVALSGGLDSSVLLHVLAGEQRLRLRAAYVDHQLHPDSAGWGRHCARFAAALGVPFTALTVKVAAGAGQGPEAAARRARYRALADVLGDGEILATAHHRDDQAETVLLNLFRGSGVAGFAGIPRIADFGRGQLLRPLLDLPRSALEAYAREVALDWVEDPSNVDQRMDRNFLRRRGLPLLEERWPGLRAALARSAGLAAEAESLLRELGARDARRLQKRGRLLVRELAALGASRQRNALRSLCRERLGSVPPERRLREGLAQILASGGDRQPLLRWSGGELRRYRDAIYLLSPLGAAPVAPAGRLEPRPGAMLELGAGMGRLRLVRSRGQGIASARLVRPLTVAYRVGGERLRPPGLPHHRELKKLLQERGIVPWMRARVPLLFSGADLVAVAHLWVAAEFAASATEPGLRVRWDLHPPLE